MPVANITDSNIDVLHKLHPPSLKLIMNIPRATRHSTRLQQCSRQKFKLSLDDMIPILKLLRRSKVPGPELYLLNILIKLTDLHERSKNKKNQRQLQTKTLANFFTTIANGDLPSSIAKIICTTYPVVLQKNHENNRKLFPLGIPSAIHRITAVCILFNNFTAMDADPRPLRKVYGRSYMIFCVDCFRDCPGQLYKDEIISFNRYTPMGCYGGPRDKSPWRERNNFFCRQFQTKFRTAIVS